MSYNDLLYCADNSGAIACMAAKALRLPSRRSGVRFPFGHNLWRFISRRSTLETVYLSWLAWPRKWRGRLTEFEWGRKRTTEDDKLPGSDHPQCPLQASISGAAMEISVVVTLSCVIPGLVTKNRQLNTWLYSSGDVDSYAACRETAAALHGCSWWRPTSITRTAGVVAASYKGRIAATVQYNTIHYSTVSTAQDSTVQYTTVQYNTAQYNMVHYSLQYSTVQYNTLYYAVQ